MPNLAALQLKNTSRAFLRSLGLFVLPFFVFFALVAATPAYAAATPPSTTGTFDCLGDYDWGCKVIGFLFEGTTVTYIKDGAPVTENPGIVEASMRKMMAFFSNAILIIASLKLLFELIQMVAETAHSGVVGGKDTNQLWAPIRLVIAIGLLVPLSSGLNSGQYIVIQVAKWGSGMASQAWKVFAEALTNGQSLSPPVAPRIDTLAANTFKNMVCARIINHYANTQTFQISELVDMHTQFQGPTQKTVFGNQIHNNVCGEILYRVPQLTADSASDQLAAGQLTQDNFFAFEQAMPSLSDQAIEIADYFTAHDATRSRPNTEALETSYNDFQHKLDEHYESNAVKNIGRAQLDKITAEIKKGADSYGWTTAGTWFLAITRAQASLINGGMNIPQAATANMTTLQEYPDAYKDYQAFAKWYGESTRTQDFTAPDPSVGTPRIKIAADDQASWARMASMTGRQVIDFILGILDSGGTALGLWSDDPRKALGDLGGSTNPFGELSALGQKHMRLGLDYFGTAISINFAGGLASLIPVAGGAISTAMYFAGTLIFGFAFLFLAAGVLLGFVVPLLPFMRFFFAIITWLGTLMEAMICAPFLALGHLTPGGQGFAGPNVKTAYFLIFQIFLRPTLSLFGMVASIMMFYVGAKFLNATFYEAIKAVAIFEGGMIYIAKVFFTVFYVAMMYIFANTSFKLMEQIPKNALRWMGGGAAEDSHEESAHGNFLSTIAPVIGANALASQMGKAATAARGFGGAIDSGKKSIQNWQSAKEGQQDKKNLLAEKAAARQHEDENEQTHGPGIRTDQQVTNHKFDQLMAQNAALLGGAAALGGGNPGSSNPGGNNPNNNPGGGSPVQGGGNNPNNPLSGGGAPRVTSTAGQPTSGPPTSDQVDQIQSTLQTQAQTLASMDARMQAQEKKPPTEAEKQKSARDDLRARGQKAIENKPKKK